MCFASSQPAPPIKKPDYSLSESHTAVKTSVTPEKPKGPDGSVETTPGATNATGPKIGRASGTNYAGM